MSRKAALGVLAALAPFSFYLLLPPTCPEPARRTAVIFGLAALFWALEILPLYATSLLVVLLETFFLTKAGGIFGLEENSSSLFLSPFANPVIILFMGGFVLAAGLHKHGVDRWVAARLLARFGEKPYFILLGFMTATAFLSMWMSNAATTALMLAMVLPLLSQLETGDPFRKALVLGVAFSANIGGIGTPVGTPPNAIALGVLAQRGIHLDFLSWMAMATPLAAVLLVICSLILYFLFPSRKIRLSFSLSDADPSQTQRFRGVVAIACLTVLLWLTSPWHKIPEAVVALLAAVFLTTLGFLDAHDFRRIEWDVLVLMWGGLALGEAMEKTGLAQWIVGLPLFSHQGFALLAVFGCLAVLVSTFVSNTATVNLLAPLAVSFTNENPVALVIIVALASSFDIPLPVATPPLAMAYGTQELRVREMLRAGIPFILIANLLVLLGVQWMANHILKIS